MRHGELHSATVSLQGATVSLHGANVGLHGSHSELPVSRVTILGSIVSL